MTTKKTLSELKAEIKELNALMSLVHEKLTEKYPHNPERVQQYTSFVKNYVKEHAIKTTK